MPALKLKDKDGNWIPLPTIKGTDGKSAYQQAVEAGYTGTEAEFYAALVSLKDGPFLPKIGGTVGGLMLGSSEASGVSFPGGGLIYSSPGGNVLLKSTDVLTIQDSSSNTPIRMAGVASPNLPTDAANKGYVDSKVAGAGGKRTCRFVVGTSTAGWTAKDCDYLCDGTDDQVEINAAIQALPATGGEVVILDGTYNITAKIAVNKDYTTLTGNGSATVLKRMWGSTTWEGVVNVVSNNNTVKNLAVDGNKTTYNSSNNTGIQLDKSANNILADNMCSNCGHGICLYGAHNSVLKGNYCSNAAAGSGIWITFSSSNNTIMGNICDHNGSGIQIYSASANTVIGNVCIDNYAGISLYSSSKNTIVGNACIRGTGLTSDYTDSEYTIQLRETSNNYNLIADNNIMGKNYTSQGGTGNTFINNKYN